MGPGQVIVVAAPKPNADVAVAIGGQREMAVGPVETVASVTPPILASAVVVGQETPLACTRCTFQNSASSTQCEMCGHTLSQWV